MGDLPINVSHYYGKMRMGQFVIKATIHNIVEVLVENAATKLVSISTV